MFEPNWWKMYEKLACFWRWRCCYQELWYDCFSGWFLILIPVAQEFTKSGGNKNLPVYLVALYLDMFLPCKTHVALSFYHCGIVSWVL